MERTTMTLKEFERVGESIGSCELVRGWIVFMSPGGTVTVAFPFESIPKKTKYGVQ